MTEINTDYIPTKNAQKLNSRYILSSKYDQANANIDTIKIPTWDLELSLLNLQELCLNIIEEIKERYKSEISLCPTFKGNINNVYLDKKLLLPILINLGVVLLKRRYSDKQDKKKKSEGKKDRWKIKAKTKEDILHKQKSYLKKWLLG